MSRPFPYEPREDYLAGEKVASSGTTTSSPSGGVRNRSALSRKWAARAENQLSNEERLLLARNRRVRSEYQAMGPLVTPASRRGPPTGRGDVASGRRFLFAPTGRKSGVGGTASAAIVVGQRNTRQTNLRVGGGSALGRRGGATGGGGGRIKNLAAMLDGANHDVEDQDEAAQLRLPRPRRRYTKADKNGDDGYSAQYRRVRAQKDLLASGGGTSSDGAGVGKKQVRVPKKIREQDSRKHQSEADEQEEEEAEDRDTIARSGAATAEADLATFLRAPLLEKLKSEAAGKNLKKKEAATKTAVNLRKLLEAATDGSRPASGGAGAASSSSRRRDRGAGGQKKYGGRTSTGRYPQEQEQPEEDSRRKQARSEAKFRAGRLEAALYENERSLRLHDVDAAMPSHLKYAQTFEVVFANYLTTSKPLRDFLFQNVQQVKVSALTFDAIELAPALVRWIRAAATPSPSRRGQQPLSVCDVCYLFVFCLTQRKSTLMVSADQMGEFVFDVLIELRDAERRPLELSELLSIAEDAFVLLQQYTKLDRSVLKLWARRTESMLTTPTASSALPSAGGPRTAASTSPGGADDAAADISAVERKQVVATSARRPLREAVIVEVDGEDPTNERAAERTVPFHPAPRTQHSQSSPTSTVKFQEQARSALEGGGRLIVRDDEIGGPGASPVLGLRRDAEENIAVISLASQSPVRVIRIQESAPASPAPPLQLQRQLKTSSTSSAPPPEGSDLLRGKYLMTARNLDVAKVMRDAELMPAAGVRTGNLERTKPLAQRTIDPNFFAGGGGGGRWMSASSTYNTNTQVLQEDGLTTTSSGRIKNMAGTEWATTSSSPTSYLDDIAIRRGRGACNPPGGIAFSAYGKYISGPEMETSMIAMEKGHALSRALKKANPILAKKTDLV